MYHVNPATTSLLVLLLLAFSRLSASKKKDCSCYQTSLGSNPALTFAHYEFYDFRSIEAKSNDDLSKPPPRIIGSEDTGQEPVTSSYFQSPDFSSAWQIQNWSQGNTSSAPVEMVNSPRNIYIRMPSQEPDFFLQPLRTAYQTHGIDKTNATSRRLLQVDPPDPPHLAPLLISVDIRALHNRNKPLPRLDPGTRPPLWSLRCGSRPFPLRRRQERNRHRAAHPRSPLDSPAHEPAWYGQ